MRVLGLVWSRIAQHSKEREKAKKRTEQKKKDKRQETRDKAGGAYTIGTSTGCQKNLSPLGMSIVVMVTLSEVVHP